jgi:hypothetical protein
MSENPAIVRLAPGQLVRKSEKRATSMSLPVVIHHRLDALAELAGASGASRAEIISMLISAREFDAAQLETDIIEYRKKKVLEVMPPDTVEPRDLEAENVIELPRRRPGRPPRNAAS